MARSHLFEFISIASVAAAALFLRVFAQMNLSRQFEWLMAITAMGGLGVVSLLTGNVGVPMNLTLLAVALLAAMGTPMAIGGTADRDWYRRAHQAAVRALSWLAVVPGAVAYGGRGEGGSRGGRGHPCPRAWSILFRLYNWNE